MNDTKMVVLYKQGALSGAGIRELKAAGFACVAIKGEFKDVQFRVAGGVGFEDVLGGTQVMILKAAFECYGFGDKLGTLVVNALKKKLAESEKCSPPTVKGDQ